MSSDSNAAAIDCAGRGEFLIRRAQLITIVNQSGNSTEPEKLSKFTSYLNTACGYSACPTEPPVTDNWGAWEDMGMRCTASCGGGKKSRTRKCLKGQPGSPGCTGSIIEWVECNTIPCPFWSEWQDRIVTFWSNICTILFNLNFKYVLQKNTDPM